MTRDQLIFAIGHLTARIELVERDTARLRDRLNARAARSKGDPA